MEDWLKQLRRGLAEFFVLAVLRKGETYGYEVFQQRAEAGALGFAEGTVYSILRRLARQRLIKVRTKDSPTGPARNYYRLTSKGAARLRRMEAHWNEIVIAMKKQLG